MPDPVVLRDPQEVPEMVPISNALRRGTSRARLRTLDVSCSRNHRLLEVFGSGENAVLLGPLGDGWGAAPLRELHRPLDETISLRVQCRCQTLRVPVNWIERQLALGKRRAIWPAIGYAIG